MVSYIGLVYFITLVVMQVSISIIFALLLLLATGSSSMVRKWIAGGRCTSNACLEGKTAIVTGANAGIGKETARDLAKRGARVILACRDVDKGAKAAKDIDIFGMGDVVVRQLDLSSLKSIRKFAMDISANEPHINILINNAGVMTTKGKTEDGFDLTFGTNHLGPFLLTNLLLPKLKASAPARVVNVTSMLYKFGVMDWDDLNLDKSGNYGMGKSYTQSKLANIYFTQDLAHRLQDTNVKTYAANPGPVTSNFGRYIPDSLPEWIRSVMAVVGPYITKTPAEGAQTSIYCAVSEEVEFQSGLFYSDCAETKLEKIAMDEKAAKKLWDISAEMVKLE